MLGAWYTVPPFSTPLKMAVLDDKRWKVDELEGTADEPKMVEITIETNQVAPLLTPPPPLF